MKSRTCRVASCTVIEACSWASLMARAARRYFSGICHSLVHHRDPLLNGSKLNLCSFTASSAICCRPLTAVCSCFWTLFVIDCAMLEVCCCACSLACTLYHRLINLRFEIMLETNQRLLLSSHHCLLVLIVLESKSLVIDHPHVVLSALLRLAVPVSSVI